MSITNKILLLIAGGQVYPPNVGGTPSILFNLLSGIDASRIDVLTGTPGIVNENTLSFKAIRLPQSSFLKIRLVWHLHILQATISFFIAGIRLMRTHKYASALLIFPETGALIGGYLASRLCGLDYHLYIIDLLADSRLNKLEWLLLKLFEKAIIRNAETVFCLNERIIELYENKVQRDYVLLPHTIATHNNLAENPAKISRQIKTITFSGQVHEISLDALQNLIRAVRLINEEEIIVQIFTNRPDSFLRDNDLLDHFVVTDFFGDSEELLSRLRESDILFSPVAFHPRYPLQAETCFPTKTFDYILAMRPILVHARRKYYYTQYMFENEGAYIVDTYTPEALKEGILNLLHDHQLQQQFVDNAMNLIKKNHNSNTLQERFLAHLFHKGSVKQPNASK